MPKFSVEVSHTVIMKATIEVTAADEDAAEKVAKTIAATSLDIEGGGDVAWELDDEDIEADFVEELHDHDA
jgi:hypothetical protein